MKNSTRTKENHIKRIYKILDKNSINKLIEEFGGTRIWIPKNGNRGHRDPESTRQRNRDIRILYLSGKDVKYLSRLYRLSTKSIYGIINSSKRDNASSSLKEPRREALLVSE